MSLFKVPAKVLLNMESIRCHFFNGIEHNGKKPIWVKWNKVLASKEKGGLGVSSFYALNRALLFKWVWRFCTQQSALWTKIIKGIHGEDGKIGKHVRSHHPSLWLDIVKEVQHIQRQGTDLMGFIHRKMGNGVDIRFWEDKWRGDNTFQSDFPRMYALETQKNISVALKLSHDDLLCSFRRAPRAGAEELQYIQLVKIMEGITLFDSKDRWRWSLEGCGEFTVASVRNLLDANSLPVVSSKTRWIKAVPIKVNIHAWKVKLDILPTRLNISKRGMDIESILCPLCEKNVESSSHIFFTCPISREIFRKVLLWWEIDVVMVSSYDEWLEWLLSIRLHSKHKELFEGVCYVLWWYIWNFRNKSIFGSACPSKALIFEECDLSTIVGMMMMTRSERPNLLLTGGMTFGSDASSIPTPLSEKLSLVTHHHLLTRVPDKLDLDNWNYGSWEYFFEQLCESYDVATYLRSPTNDIDTSSSTPLTPEENKVDKILLSWLLFTLSDSLRVRLVVARPKTAKEASALIFFLIVKDNKRSRANALKAELRSIKLGAQSMESYFQKINPIVTILTSLDARVNDEDVVHYALEGLPDTYNSVCGYMHWKDTFPDLKTVRSLLITKEMRLKSKALDLPVDSSSPMVLMTEARTNSRSSMSQGKPWKPCFNFAKGSCRYGDSCHYVHDANARVSNTNSGMNSTIPNSVIVALNNTTSPGNSLGPHAFFASPNPSPGPNITAPPDFPPMAQAHVPTYFTATNNTNQAHVTPSTATGPVMQPNGYVSHALGPATQSGAGTYSGQATLLPQAFTAGTLYDPTTGAWNMDTGASSHLNNYVTSLSIVLKSCMYLSVLVGDGHFIPVTNTGHSILSTPLKSLRLNNVLITPHIVKNLISVRQFVRDNDCTIEFDSFGFSVKDFMTRQVLLRCDSTEDLYPVTHPSPIPSAFLVSQHTWHQRLGHPGSEVLRRLVSNNVISCNKEKPPVLCHACQLGKHVRLPFVSSTTIVSSCFEIVHSD
ncbi:ribonuclease H-like domain-containing protein, partial [Tanacetum coccineum]